jgi:hypothetical protein
VRLEQAELRVKPMPRNSGISQSNTPGVILEPGQRKACQTNHMIVANANHPRLIKINRLRSLCETTGLDVSTPISSFLNSLQILKCAFVFW